MKSKACLYGSWILCGILLIALIVVGAFAYQWRRDLKDITTKYSTLKALSDSSTIESMSNEAGELNVKIQELTSQNEQLQKKIDEYEAILTENALMPE